MVESGSSRIERTPMPDNDTDLSVSRRRGLARAYVGHSSARDLARIEPMFDPTATYRSTGVGDFSGRAAIVEMMAGFFDRFPDVTWQVESYRPLGADGVEFNFVMRATGRDGGEAIERPGVERLFFTPGGLIRAVEVDTNQ